MHLLLDTHVLLWWLADDTSLTQIQRMAIQDKRNSCYISAATIWEISIKSRLGKLDVDEEYLEVVKSPGFLELPITWQHAKTVKSLPDIHKDPFDRILIAQAIVEGMSLICTDTIIAQYNVRLI